MTGRDPFPMSSPEAQKLAGESGEEGNWHSMSTQSAHQGPRDTSVVDGAEEDGLVSSKKKSTGNIYDDADVLEEKERGDPFLDTPLSDTRGTRFERALAANIRFLERIYHNLYGDSLPPSEMIRTLTLASTLFFMIGGYWLLRSLKDPVLTALCGVAVIPKAKMLSVFVVLGVVSIYNKLLDSDIPKHHLFYIFGTFYFGLFTIISFLLMHPTIGLANQQPDPSRILGWISYCSIESFGSVMVSLFWSFANSNISLETAKASYGVMVAAAQVGSIIGPTIVKQFAAKIGVAHCYLVGALCMLMLQCTMYTYINRYGSAERNASDGGAAAGKQKKKEKAGVTEGLYLFWDHNYVKGIFAISCLFMVEVTIVDYTMKVLARDFFADKFPCERGMSCFNAVTGEHGMSEASTEAFTSFMGFFGQATNTLSFLMSLLGTSAIIRYLGLRMTLLLFPTLCLAVIIFVRLHPTLYVVFGAMMMLKASSYALNNPTKEMLYQPTSSAVRYKAKSWIDIFGARGSKALGSVVTNAFSDSAKNLVANGSLVGMAVATFLIWNATYMGKTFDEYTEMGYIVGGDTNQPMQTREAAEQESIQLAIVQNEVPDTSCAMVEDDDEIGPLEEGQSDESGGSKDEEDEEAETSKLL
ncbi:ATP carrier protein 1 [Seminavis robusta]|uniref:ADP,ATP carrier protein n=1 Tax=Seminavis robusta TaxID=568900 RepID=A0A9N8HW74_9STRA|nr:ATP carrier protein 1 [Seminavis robusta]|eukprot:Sro2552_g330980.1 ATP carrier protein 1 (641) ;mRNA; f:4298-6220